MPIEFLTEDPDTANSMDDFKAAGVIVRTLSVTNDHAARAVTQGRSAVRALQELRTFVACALSRRSDSENFPDARKFYPT